MNLAFIKWFLFVCCSYHVVVAQTPVSQSPVIKKALTFLEKIEPETISEQILICEIPAPPFKEESRMVYIKKRFTELGLQNVRVDEVGNIIGEYTGRSTEPLLVLSAHLDTVFPESTEIKVTRDGHILRAPGISDDSRGLAVILAVARALKQFNIQTEGSILFVGTVGEEGVGNLRGVRHLFKDLVSSKITHFISIDDVGLKTFNTAVGSDRFRVTFSGIGGHSYANFGISNPIHALGRTIAKFSDFIVPKKPKTTFNVGRIGGGTSVNSIAHSSWMEVDLRSEDRIELGKLNAAFHKAVLASLREENRRWNSKDTLTVEITSLGKRPAGKLADDAEILNAVVRADQALNIKTDFRSGSTDSNIPISLGIPAVTLSGGGGGTYKHSLRETFDTRNSHLGTQRALLTLLEIVGIKPVAR